MMDAIGEDIVFWMLTGTKPGPPDEPIDDEAVVRSQPYQELVAANSRLTERLEELQAAAADREAIPAHAPLAGGAVDLTELPVTLEALVAWALADWSGLDMEYQRHLESVFRRLTEGCRQHALWLLLQTGWHPQEPLAPPAVECLHWALSLLKDTSGAAADERRNLLYASVRSLHEAKQRAALLDRVKEPGPESRALSVHEPLAPAPAPADRLQAVKAAIFYGLDQDLARGDIDQEAYTELRQAVEVGLAAQTARLRSQAGEGAD